MRAFSVLALLCKSDPTMFFLSRKLVCAIIEYFFAVGQKLFYKSLKCLCEREKDFVATNCVAGENPPLRMIHWGARAVKSTPVGRLQVSFFYFTLFLSMIYIMMYVVEI